MITTKLYQCFHDHGSMPPRKYTSPIRPALLCGADVEWRHTGNIKNVLRDNTGDNISSENMQYSVLTGCYWIWKNVKDVDIVGIEHYRRHFIYRNSPIEDYVHTEDLINDAYIIGILQETDFILPVHQTLANTSVYDLYKICFHEQADEIVKWMNRCFKDSPKYLEAMYAYLSHGNITRANMLITTWHDYASYCEALFGLLDYMKANMPVEPDSRVWGYVAELFPIIYVTANNKKYVEVDVAVDDFDQELQKEVVYTTQNQKIEPFDQKTPEEQIEHLKTI